jgi:hypothetical protein
VRPPGDESIDVADAWLPKDIQLDRHEILDLQESDEEYLRTECICRTIEEDRRESLAWRLARLTTEERDD